MAEKKGPSESHQDNHGGGKREKDRWQILLHLHVKKWQGEKEIWPTTGRPTGVIRVFFQCGGSGGGGKKNFSRLVVRILEC